MANAAYTDAQFNKLVAEVKKNPGQSERHYSEASGVAMAQIGKALYLAEVKADPSLDFSALSPAKMADKLVAERNKGVRWPRLAVRSGLPESQVKEIWREKTGKDPRESYTGRGRNFSGTESTARPTGGTSGRRGQAAGNTGTSGRRGSAAAAQPTSGRRGAAAPAGRRGTRAGAADPR